MKHGKKIIKSFGSAVIFTLFALLSVHSMAFENSITDILNAINKLEKKSEPKCYATASRLEDFMFGTPLNDDARFTKNILQKQFIEKVWLQSSLLALAEQEDVILSSHVSQATDGIFAKSLDANGHYKLKFSSGMELTIHKDDKRQYASIAYSLRAILAVQQDNLLNFESHLSPLSESAIEQLKDSLDLYTLAVLKVADTKAKADSEHLITVENIISVWQELGNIQAKKTAVAKVKKQYRKIEPTFVKQMTAGKLSAYAAYNKVNNQLFMRNLQVYFARVSWPKDQEESTRIIEKFAEITSKFSADLYSGSQKVAMENGFSVISEESVHDFAREFIPHQLNEYEDVLFFPNLPKAQQVYLESYDMDAFRDAGVHWQYLNQAILSPNFTVYIEPDPFAAELLVENIAQYGVLLLRVAGIEAVRLGEERLREEHLVIAKKLLDKKVMLHLKSKPELDTDTMIHSVNDNSVAADKSALNKPMPFLNVTRSAGINFDHKSSDWLNRQLRSFIKKDATTGIITIPPAFGGSGVAVEDINADGFMDVLLLGGRGNKLFINQKNGHFIDKTSDYGLNWLREEDNHAGEVRQPLIADINNDGWQDIIITYVNDSHRVYKNIQGKRFEDVTSTAGIGGKGQVGGPATLFDFDNDGDLDLYITYFGNYLRGDLPTLKRRNSNGEANQLFENVGGFSFKNVTEHSGLDNMGWAQAVAHTDINNDGWQDVIVGNDFGVNGYYINDKNGHFTEISEQLSTDKPSYTMGIGISDLNGDSLPDFYISNIVTMNKDESYILPNEDTKLKFNADKLAHMKVIEANDLFLSSIKGNKQKYQASNKVGRGYSSTGWSWDADFFDYDLDGDDDLYVLNGMNEFNIYSSKNPYYKDPNDESVKQSLMPVSSKERNVFFENSAGKLNNMSKASGLDLLGNSRSASYFDRDNDGDLDIIINNYHEEAALFDNQLNHADRHWLKVKLVGNPKKHVTLDAIGAKIIVTLPTKAKVWREIRATDGYMSVHPKEQHLGVGKAEFVDIQVIWPNGEVKWLPQVKSNQRLEIKL